MMGELERPEYNELCDESKCVSRGLSTRHGNSFTCYGDENGEFYPMMCADGYEPKSVNSVPSAFDDAYPPWTSRYFGSEGVPPSVPLQYFTCCPRDFAFEGEVTRQCSGPILIEDDDGLNMACNNENNTGQIYPRRMETYYQDLTYQVRPKGSMTADSFVCCQTPPIENNNNFLSDIDCVPYHDKNYAESKVTNKKYSYDYGMLVGMVCDFDEIDFPYPYPKIIEANRTTTAVAYQCCKTGAPIPTFAKEPAYYWTYYPQIAGCLVASALCLLLLVSLLVPLVLSLKQQRHSQTQMSSRRRRSSHSIDRIETYSPYNVYIIYLSIPDLLVNLVMVAWLYRNTIKRVSDMDFVYHTPYGFTMHAPPWVTTTGITYYAMNCWMNVVISYEVMRLLEHSHRYERMAPITLRRVNLQAGIVYAVAVVFFIHSFRVIIIGSKGVRSEDTYFALFFFTGMIGMCVPIVLVLFIGLKIWWCSYIPPAHRTTTASDRAMRELFWYFSRIIVVFVATWIPPLTASYLSAAGDINKLTYQAIGVYCLGLQPILTFVITLTKSDVRKYVLDLVTISHCRAKHRHGVDFVPSSELDLVTGTTASKSSRMFQMVNGAVQYDAESTPTSAFPSDSELMSERSVAQTQSVEP